MKVSCYTFPPIKINHEEAVRKFQAAGRTLHLVPIGGVITVWKRFESTNG